LTSLLSARKWKSSKSEKDYLKGGTGSWQNMKSRNRISRTNWWT
jgi:hypothetical protein